MDLHQRSATFCAKDKEGNLVAEQKVVTSPEEIRKFIDNLASDNLSLAVEPVSQWYFYADLLESLGVDVHLANPLKVKAIASARIKTDKIDARVLCDLLRGNLLPEAYFSGKEMRSWKEQVRLRASLINLRTQTKNKVHSLLWKNGLTFSATNLFGKAGNVWLHSLKLPDQFQISLTEYLKLIENLNAMVKEADLRIETTVGDNLQAKLLTSVPGVSYVSALTIISEIGDINRFPSAKQLCGYAGLVPSTYASGQSMRHGRITKQGSRWLRYVMVEIAHRQILCKKKQGFGWYYLKMRARSGSGTAAVATARKLCAVVWRLLKDNRPFEERLQTVGSPMTPVKIISSNSL